MLTIIFATTAGATLAYFSSTAIAAGNEVKTGMLRLALDSTRKHVLEETPTYGLPTDTAYNVVTDGIPGGSPFESWEGAMPGAYFNYWVAFRNASDVSFAPRGTHLGEWSSLPRAGTTGCPSTTEEADPSLVSIDQIHRYSPSGDCESDVECKNLRNSLTTAGWDAKPLTDTELGTIPNGTPFDLQTGPMSPDEFVILKIKLVLNAQDTNSCYQGATYTYILRGEAMQEGGAWF